MITNKSITKWKFIITRTIRTSKTRKGYCLEREKSQIKIIRFLAEWTDDDSTRILKSIREINDDENLEIGQKWSQLERIIQDLIIELKLANSLLKENIDAINNQLETNFKIRQTKEAIQKLINQENKLKELLQEKQELL